MEVYLRGKPNAERSVLGHVTICEQSEYIILLRPKRTKAKACRTTMPARASVMRFVAKCRKWRSRSRRERFLLPTDKSSKAVDRGKEIRQSRARTECCKGQGGQM